MLVGDFCLREEHFIKLTMLGVQGRNLASLLAGNGAVGCSVLMHLALWGCPTVGMLYCGRKGILVLWNAPDPAVQQLPHFWQARAGSLGSLLHR